MPHDSTLVQEVYCSGREDESAMGGFVAGADRFGGAGVAVLRLGDEASSTGLRVMEGGNHWIPAYAGMTGARGCGVDFGGSVGARQ